MNDLAHNNVTGTGNILLTLLGAAGLPHSTGRMRHNQKVPSATLVLRSLPQESATATSSIGLPPIGRNQDSALEIEVESRVHGIIRQVTAELGISIPNDRLPSVKIHHGEEPSSYRSAQRQISLNSKDLTDGATYGEEIMHWIRFQSESADQKPISLAAHFAVDELFGYLGRTVAALSCQDTEYAGLFVNSGPEDCGWMSRDIHLLQNLKENLESAAKEHRDRNSPLSTLKDAQDSAVQALDLVTGSEQNYEVLLTALTNSNAPTATYRALAEQCCLSEGPAIKSIMNTLTALTAVEEAGAAVLACCEAVSDRETQLSDETWIEVAQFIKARSQFKEALLAPMLKQIDLWQVGQKAATYLGSLERHAAGYLSAQSFLRKVEDSSKADLLCIIGAMLTRTPSEIFAEFIYFNEKGEPLREI